MCNKLHLPIFGPAGIDSDFPASGYKHSYELPLWLKSLGLSAYEYQCGRGVRINPDSAEKLKKNSEECGITLSLHAPYFISLSGTETETRLKSIDYIMQSAQAARVIGARRIIVHSGSCAKITREQAMLLAKDTLKKAQDSLDENGYGDIIICPETMGKINQLGTLEEVLELCTVDDRFIPAVDFGHLNARTLGGIRSAEDYKEIISLIIGSLGYDRAKSFHIHFSKIEYSNGGEKRHLTLEDNQYGPDFEPLAEILYKNSLTPTVICESDGCMATDAAKLMRMYVSASQ